MTRDLFSRPFVHRIALLLLCALLASCGRPGTTVVDPTATAVSTPSASTTATPNLNTTATASPTATLTGPQLDATTTVNEAIMRHAAETALALNPTPDLNWIPPTPDGPTPVRLRTGFSTGCADESEVHNLVINNCWVNVVNGEYVWVDAGSRRADTSIGRIDVFTFALDFSDQSSRQYYETPQANGAVTIIAVTGAHMILQYPDSSTVAFNLTTRAWEDPSTFPSPSPTVLPTSTILPTVSPTSTAILTALPTSIPTPTSGSSATATAPPTGGSFPATSVLDTFNRANGAIGSAWLGDTTGYTITSNMLAADDAGRLNWNASFGADQEAYVILNAIDIYATDIDLLLKGQDQGDCNVLEIWYQPSRGSVEVWTCDASNGWHQQGSAISVTFAAGDQFGARAHANGTVGVYRNDTLLGSVAIGTNWEYRAAGGKIGVWLINASSAVLDDFGGGTLGSGTATNTPTSTSGATATVAPTNTPMPTSSATATVTATATVVPTSTPTPTSGPTATPTSGSFPSLSVLDTFNRANGAIGSAWVGNTTGYAIASNKLAVSTGDPLYWNTSFGANQETYVTLSAIDIYATEIDLLLKGQDQSDCNVLEIWYQPSRGTVQVWTCDDTNGWHKQGSDIAVTFAAGDQFGARAHADGTVGVYRNGTLLGSATIGTNWEYPAAGGKIGVWMINASSTVLDDFGGGTLP